MKDIYTILQDLGITYKKYEHPPLHTVEDADNFFNSIETEIFWKNKNLFLRNDKKDKYILVTLQAHKRLDIKKIAEIFGERRLSFASDQDLFDILGLRPGSVSPFGLVNDIEKKVLFAIDKDVFDFERTIFHPNINTISLEISIQDLREYLNFVREKYFLLDI